MQKDNFMNAKRKQTIWRRILCLCYVLQEQFLLTGMVTNKKRRRI